MEANTLNLSTTTDGFLKKHVKVMLTRPCVEDQHFGKNFLPDDSAREVGSWLFFSEEKKMKYWPTLSLLSLLFWLGCSSPSGLDRVREVQDSAKPRAAAYAADGFMMEHRGFQERPYQAWEFYYKHCALVSRNPYPSRAEYACSEPR